jgi:uncharacterized repeat protein (TIGR03803 family)
MKCNGRLIKFAAALAILTLSLSMTARHAIAQETVLYNFTGGSDGSTALAPLISDSSGNLYGTTEYGGAYANGTVFELTPQAGGSWTETVLHSFGNGSDARNPWDGVIFDALGNLYGTTYSGGTYKFGTVFELSPQAGGGWTETVLHNFKAGDGQQPTGSLIFDNAGNLYGTTGQGGAFGEGVVFKLSPQPGGTWTETVLHSFNPSGPDGQVPTCTLIFDTAGNLYGTTGYGGTFGHGTVFELSPNSSGGWTEKRLANFSNSGNSPYYPTAGLVFDAAGNLYTTTFYGGFYSDGTVVELSPKAGGGWTAKVIHNFNGTDGHEPFDSLIIDSSGNLYGTTYAGGANGGGVAFELSPKAGGGWTEKTLHSFAGTGTTDGGYPYASLMFDASGNLYGTTSANGTGLHGTVFKIAH